MSKEKEFLKMVLKEMEERKSKGQFVPKEAFEVANDPEQILDYSHMEISDCVDLVISLSQI